MATPEPSYLVPLVGIGAAIIAGLFTLLGVLLANRASQKKLEMQLKHEKYLSSKEALRERLEELYQLVDQWAGSFVIHHVTYRRVMEGIITYNQALDLEIENKTSVNAARMFTLAELYFPTCHKQLGEIKSLRELCSSIHSEFKEMHRHSGAQSTKHADEITKALELFNNAIDAYKNQLSEYVRMV